MKQQKVCIVTGASRGVGKAIAIDLAKEHFSLALVGRDQAALQEVADLCTAHGVKAKAYAVDMRDSAQLAALAGKVCSDLGGINVLINNAGVYIEKPISSLTEQDWDETFDVNLKAIFLLSQQALPYLKGREQAAIINVGSVASERGYARGTAYSGSKHALMGFTESLFQDIREMGIKVSVINPGVIDTDMHKDDPRFEKTKMLKPEDISQAVRFIVNFPGHACPTEITLLPQLNPRLPN
jgi:3-oxoacyl-[acyl-carrier protein] reductase